MKRLVFIAMCVLALVGWASWLQAATELAWDRNTEVDMLQYRVYSCAVKGCTAVKGVTPTATIPQVIVGAVPKWPLPANTEGAAVVTAVDTSNNESGATVSVPFDTKAPAIPANPVVQ